MITLSLTLPDSHHLATRKETAIAGPRGDESTVLDKVLNLLDLSMSDFSPEGPFTSYGMVSLAATRVSETLCKGLSNTALRWYDLESPGGEGARERHCYGSPTTNPAEPLLKMVEKYSKNLEDHFPIIETSQGRCHRDHWNEWITRVERSRRMSEGSERQTHLRVEPAVSRPGEDPYYRTCSQCHQRIGLGRLPVVL